MNFEPSDIEGVRPIGNWGNDEVRGESGDAPRSGISLTRAEETETDGGESTGQGGKIIRWNGEKLIQLTGFSIGGPGLRSWMLSFRPSDAYRFYGLGEKTGPLEHSGRQTVFWNSDVWGDFPMEQIREANPDPQYISIPYTLMRCGENGWLGLFIDSMYPSWMSLCANPHIEVLENLGVESQFFAAAEDGQPRIFFIAGDSPADVTRSLQLLIGVHERPPLWALGHQQSRWGYASRRDLESVRNHFGEYKIPNDGLWLDIDYMDGYRVFTFNDKHFPSPQKDIEELQAGGQQVVPILDPGIRKDPSFAPYNEGREDNLFCKNSTGGDYVGYVWPGDTVFPDFSLLKTRKWWAGHVARLIGMGLRGFWVDMNEPATGTADPMEMLFRDGTKPHGWFHNHYALGMQQATWMGFQEGAPDLRPFILSRSGSPGTSRYAAVWLGDNISNYHHLRQTIVTGMNLGLSGIPFWGADVPGFGDDADGELAADWYKAAFLQPFLRNHSCMGTVEQEPWRFGSRIRRVIGHYIRLRYRFLPYMYNLFIEHEAKGEGILTPVWYHFPESFEESGKLEDQFMIGPSLLQAPGVERGASRRSVYLPSGWWFDASEGRWHKGGRNVNISLDEDRSGLFLRENHLIPMLRKVPKNNRINISDIELHVLMRRKSRETATCRYLYDDGLTRGYRRGNESSVEFRIQVQGGRLEVYLEHEMQGHGPLKISFVLYDEFESIVLHSSTGKLHGKSLSLNPSVRRLTGDSLDLLGTKSFVFTLR